MTDLEMTKLCAQAMGWRPAGERKDFDTVKAIPVAQFPGAPHYQYAPLHDDSAVMALVKKFGLTIDPQEDKPPFTWRVVVANDGDWDDQIFSQGSDLNRAIVECVAKIVTSSQRGQHE